MIDLESLSKEELIDKLNEANEKLIQESVSDITQQLYTKAEKDGMTGLFKKESMQEQILHFM